MLIYCVVYLQLVFIKTGFKAWKHFSRMHSENTEGGTKLQNEDVKEKSGKTEGRKERSDKTINSLKSLSPGHWLRAGLTSTDL